MSDFPAGRELDALVAEKVMGWTLAAPEYVMGYLSHGGSMMRLWAGPGMPNAKGERYSDEGFRPSTDMAFAWQVVEKLGRFSIRDKRQQNPPTVGWDALFTRPTETDPRRDEWFSAEAETTPLAICRAALKAVGA